MVFDPQPFATSIQPVISDLSGIIWTPMLQNSCLFGTAIFEDVMVNLVENPNLLSTWLFRADILLDQTYACEEKDDEEADPREPEAMQMHFPQFKRHRLFVRRLIPRNPRRDVALEQTCIFYRSVDTLNKARSLVVYIPHHTSEDTLPFYHPRVRGIAYLHEWDSSADQGIISIHYHLFRPADAHENKLVRTSRRLLSVAHKHGQGRTAGYTKRVHHDVLIPQARFQDRYSELKQKHAKLLVDTWAEQTDPAKHVFEDLGIAAFLIELWADMYRGKPFPGFVDIGCGNGLLVHVLLEEGYTGWGFDARERKSWANYSERTSPSASTEYFGESRPLPPLRRQVLLPSLLSTSMALGVMEGRESAKSNQQCAHQAPSTYGGESGASSASRKQISVTPAISPVGAPCYFEHNDKQAFSEASSEAEQMTSPIPPGSKQSERAVTSGNVRQAEECSWSANNFRCAHGANLLNMSTWPVPSREVDELAALPLPVRHRCPPVSYDAQGAGHESEHRRTPPDVSPELRGELGSDQSAGDTQHADPALATAESHCHVGASPDAIHTGTFPRGTFIISNHADELTPWTPVLAALSDCPFLMIPCCSYDFKAAKFRAPPPKDASGSRSTYASLVNWVATIAEECGFTVEREMLRIPSTRNVALLGRRRVTGTGEIDVRAVVERNGGMHGYVENVMKLTKGAPKGH